MSSTVIDHGLNLACQITVLQKDTRYRCNQWVVLVVMRILNELMSTYVTLESHDVSGRKPWMRERRCITTIYVLKTFVDI